MTTPQVNFSKPPLPVPNGSEMWVHAMWAYAAGWCNGYSDPGSVLAAKDDVTQATGNAVSIAPGNYITDDVGGRALRNASDVSEDPFLFDNLGDRYHPTTGEVSILMICRLLEIAPSGTANGAVDKGTAPASTTNMEYSLGVDGTSSRWRMYVTPPAGASNAVTGPAASLSTARTDIVIGTYRSTPAEMKLYQNGEEVGSVVPANTGIKNISALDLGFFQMKGGTGSTQLRGFIGYGAVLDRFVWPEEVNVLSSLAYDMWDEDPNPAFFDFVPAMAGGPQNLMLSF